MDFNRVATQIFDEMQKTYLKQFQETTKMNLRKMMNINQDTVLDRNLFRVLIIDLKNF